MLELDVSSLDHAIAELISEARREVTAYALESTHDIVAGDATLEEVTEVITEACNELCKTLRQGIHGIELDAVHFPRELADKV